MAVTDDDNSGKTPIFLHPRIKAQFFKRGQALFNDESFFEAHEEWEKLWKMDLGVEKTWLQGLIQVAGHYVLLKEHRYGAAYRMALAALEKLSVTLPDHSYYRVFDLEPIVSGLHYNMQIIAPHFAADHDHKAADADQTPFEAFLTTKLFER